MENSSSTAICLTPLIETAWGNVNTLFKYPEFFNSTDLVPSSLVAGLRYAYADVCANCDHGPPKSRETGRTVDVGTGYGRRATTRTERLLHFADRPVKRRSTDVYAADVLAYGVYGIVSEGTVGHDAQPERLSILRMQCLGVAGLGLDDSVTPVLSDLLR